MSMGIIKSGEYTQVAGNASGEASVIESHTLLTKSLPPRDVTNIIQITIPKGKWTVIGHVHTSMITAGKAIALTISINDNTYLLDHRYNNYAGQAFAHGMVYIDATSGPVTAYLQVEPVGTSENINVMDAEITAIKVSD